MLIWVCALHCEAKPVIDHYRLKKSPQHRAFDLFRNDDMCCVISGIGNTAAAAATAWVGGLQHESNSLCWINLGVAGGADYIQGEIFSLNKITDQPSGRSYYPVPAFRSSMKSAPCISLDKASIDYHPVDLYDMEASAYFATATRFSSAELVQSVKVISDNQQQQPVRDKSTISQLIYNQLPSIKDFAKKLGGINQQMVELESMPEVWQGLLQRVRFSQTQQARLKTLLAFLQHLDTDKEVIFDNLDKLESSREIIQVLEQRCSQYSRNL